MNAEDKLQKVRNFLRYKRLENEIAADAALGINAEYYEKFTYAARNLKTVEDFLMDIDFGALDALEKEIA